MISATVEPQTEAGTNASRRKRCHLRPAMAIAVAVAFAVQVGLLFWLGNPPVIKPARPPTPPVIHFDANGSEELLALQDQTLFVLPHRDNFSGAAWLKMSPQTFEPTNWTEPALPLPLPPEQLGAAFADFMQTNPPPRFQPQMNSGFVDLDVAAMEPISASSELRVEGDLAHLRLLTPVDLPPQTNPDLLTNTVVQLLVDAQGKPFSAVIWASSGKPEADADALNFAKAARFEPAQVAGVGTVPPDTMTLGKLVFEWQTVPPPPTNTPPATP
jgi:TonB family protein